MPQNKRDHYNDVIGHVLTELREELCLSQTDAAQQMGWTAGGLSYIERNGSLKVADFMRLALNVYGQNPSDLMKRVERVLLMDTDTEYVNPYRDRGRR